jgi:drug/metabolite transporter (DMT)-like permease
MSDERRPGSTRWAGLGTMMAGYFVLGLQPVPVKALADLGYSPGANSTMRFAIQGALVGVMALLGRRALRIQKPALLALRGLFGGVAVLCYFTSVEWAGAGRATVLNYTYPVWANLIAAWFGVRLPLLFWGNLLLATIGAALVSGVGGVDGRAPSWGDVAGIVGAMVAGGSVLTIKKLRETEGELEIVAAFSLGGLLVSVPFWVWQGALDDLERGWPTPAAWALFALVGAASFFGHILFTRAYDRVSVPVGSMFSLTVPLFATALGVVLLGERVTWLQGLGTLGILLALVGMSRIPSAAAREAREAAQRVGAQEPAQRPEAQEPAQRPEAPR